MNIAERLQLLSDLHRKYGLSDEDLIALVKILILGEKIPMHNEGPAILLGKLIKDDG